MVDPGKMMPLCLESGKALAFRQVIRREGLPILMLLYFSAVQ